MQLNNSYVTLLLNLCVNVITENIIPIINSMKMKLTIANHYFKKFHFN